MIFEYDGKYYRSSLQLGYKLIEDNMVLKIEDWKNNSHFCTREMLLEIVKDNSVNLKVLMGYYNDYKDKRIQELIDFGFIKEINPKKFNVQISLSFNFSTYQKDQQSALEYVQSNIENIIDDYVSNEDYEFEISEVKE